MNYQELMNKLKSKEIVLSFSSLKQFARSPEHFIRYKLFKPLPTQAMIFGSLVDCLIFEKEKLHDKFLIGSTVPTSKNQKAFCDIIIRQVGSVKEISGEMIDNAFNECYKKGKAIDVYNELESYIKGLINNKYPVSQHDIDLANRMNEKLYSNKAGSKLMNKFTETQKKIEFEYLGWKFIGYADAVGENLICDLKTTDAEPDKISRFIYQNKTYVQLAIYSYGLKMEKEEFKVLALDKNENISVNNISKDYILYGLKEFKNWVKDFNKCVMMNKFNYNYDFFGKHKGEYLVNKPLYANTLMEIYD